MIPPAMFIKSLEEKLQRGETPISVTFSLTLGAFIRGSIINQIRMVLDIGIGDTLDKRAIRYEITEYPGWFESAYRIKIWTPNRETFIHSIALQKALLSYTNC